MHADSRAKKTADKFRAKTGWLKFVEFVLLVKIQVLFFWGENYKMGQILIATFDLIPECRTFLERKHINGRQKTEVGGVI